METVYEIVCHPPNGNIELLPRPRRRRYRTAAEAVQALQACLGSGATARYAVEESQVAHGAATASSSHASVSFPTERVHTRRVVAHAVPLPATSLGATVGVLSFAVRSVGPEATAAGMLVGDRVTRLGGLPIEDAVALRDALERHQPGEVVPVEVEREGQRLTLALKLSEGEAAGRYALEVLAGVEVPPVSRFDRVATLDRLGVRVRPLRPRSR